MTDQPSTSAASESTLDAFERRVTARRHKCVYECVVCGDTTTKAALEFSRLQAELRQAREEIEKLNNERIEFFGQGAYSRHQQDQQRITELEQERTRLLAAVDPMLFGYGVGSRGPELLEYLETRDWDRFFEFIASLAESRAPVAAAEGE